APACPGATSAKFVFSFVCSTVYRKTHVNFFAAKLKTCHSDRSEPTLFLSRSLPVSASARVVEEPLFDLQYAHDSYLDFVFPSLLHRFITSRSLCPAITLSITANKSRA